MVRLNAALRPVQVLSSPLGSQPELLASSHLCAWQGVIESENAGDVCQPGERQGYRLSRSKLFAPLLLPFIALFPFIPSKLVRFLPELESSSLSSARSPSPLASTS